MPAVVTLPHPQQRELTVIRAAILGHLGSQHITNIGAGSKPPTII